MLLTQNSKMKKSGKRVFNFTLPALITCPNAGACATGCYARQGTYLFSNVKAKHAANLEATKNLAQFKIDISNEIKRLKPTHVRIHDAGDFYTMDYLNAWRSIAKTFPDITFYAYTKQVKMIKAAILKYGPMPIKIIFSQGGKQDALITDTDRHSKVFETIEDLEAAGYINASDNDLMALTDNHKVGLVYHGAKNYSNTNWNKLTA